MCTAADCCITCHSFSGNAEPSVIAEIITLARTPKPEKINKNSYKIANQLRLANVIVFTGDCDVFLERNIFSKMSVF